MERLEIAAWQPFFLLKCRGFPLKRTVRTRKLMLGRRSFHFGGWPIFKVLLLFVFGDRTCCLFDVLFVGALIFAQPFFWHIWGYLPNLVTYGHMSNHAIPKAIWTFLCPTIWHMLSTNRTSLDISEATYQMDLELADPCPWDAGAAWCHPWGWLGEMTFVGGVTWGWRMMKTWLVSSIFFKFLPLSLGKWSNLTI